MTYKGYHGTVTFDDEAEIFHGEVTDHTDVVTFQGRSVDELKTAFHESIGDYLDFVLSVARSQIVLIRGISFYVWIRSFTGSLLHLVGKMDRA